MKNRKDLLNNTMFFFFFFYRQYLNLGIENYWFINITLFNRSLCSLYLLLNLSLRNCDIKYIDINLFHEKKALIRFS